MILLILLGSDNSKHNNNHKIIGRVFSYRVPLKHPKSRNNLERANAPVFYRVTVKILYNHGPC